MSVMNRLLDPIKKKIFLLIGRAILTAVDNSGKIMKVQVTGLNGETIPSIEHPENYGFAHYPIKDNCEVVNLFINGNRDQGLAIIMHDRTYRPTDLEEGEARMYYKGQYKVSCKSDGVIINGGAESYVLGDAFMTWLTTFVNTTFNTHTHISAAPGVASGLPVPTGSPPSGVLSTTIKGK